MCPGRTVIWMVGLGGLEPPTWPLSVLRSSVSYHAPFNRGRCF